jgi:hypothetical protein
MWVETAAKQCNWVWNEGDKQKRKATGTRSLRPLALLSRTWLWN